MATSLALAREAKKRKRENIKNKLERMQSAEKQKLESAFETVQSNDNSNIRRIADLALIIKGLQQGCNQCSNTPLLLTDCHISNLHHPNSLMVICQNCNNKCKIKIHSDEVEEKLVLGSLHIGIGFTHVEGLLSIVGLPCFSNGSYKKTERKIGPALEKVARESCLKWKQEEEKLEIEKTGSKALKGCYDMSWRTKTRQYNSKSGTGCIIGHNTGKCIDFQTRNKDCRYCDLALRNGREPKEHECRKNLSGSSKSMESEVCQDLFSKGDYKVMITDEDGTSEAKVKSNVNADIEKWSDKNHVVRILGKMLYDAKKTDFGPNNDRINDAVIDYIRSLLSIALSKHKGDAKGMQDAILSIVPHAFGYHGRCGAWCRFKENPKEYKHKYLPGGKDLTGNGVTAFLEETTAEFATSEYIKKLEQLGSTQRN